jgi:hypothetical protein
MKDLMTDLEKRRIMSKVVLGNISPDTILINGVFLVFSQ